MKRRLAILTGVITFMTIMNTGVTAAYAAPVQATGCIAFMDENGDGICDICGACAGFVDEDGDGICDNWNANAGWGRGYGRRNGCGRGSRGNGCGRGGRW